MKTKKQVRYVLITMFQPADGPGEIAHFIDLWGLSPVSVPETGLSDLYWSEEKGILALLAGVGTANTAVSMMALWLTQDFDFRQTQWIICGIAGGNPHTSTIGDVVLCDWCVDADFAFEVDPRELPEDWETGILPIGASQPYGPSAMDPQLFGRPYQSFALPAAYREQAMEALADVALQDDAAAQAERGQYEGFFTQAALPSLRVGSCISGARFWHGKLLNEWAEKWVSHFSEGKGVFMVSGMEDTGTLLALQHGAQLGLLDAEKILLVRAVSNFTCPPVGKSAMDSLHGEGDGDYTGMQLALQNAFAVVDVVVG